MKSPAQKPLKNIEKHITKKESSAPISTRDKTISTFKPSRILEEAEQIKNEKKPEEKKATMNSSGKKSSNIYIPREKEIKFIETQTKMIYDQLGQIANYKVQNPHSLFLNQKNPKLPIYQRAAQITEGREAALEEKRRERLRLKEQEQLKEYEQFKSQQAGKKTISKEQAQGLSDRLYKQHYSKTNRLNEKKIRQYHEESKQYRQKPLISNKSKDLFNVIAEKNKLQTDIIDRFGQYQLQKVQKEKLILQSYKNKYYPFRPSISVNAINTQQSPELSKSTHCLSSRLMKTEPSKKPLSKSPRSTVGEHP